MRAVIFKRKLFIETGVELAKVEKTKISAGGKTTINGKQANYVILTTAKSVQIKLYFDAATNLLLREEIPNGTSLKVIDYGDYRKVDDVFEAFSNRFKIRQ